jgi:hypothetical protein
VTYQRLRWSPNAFNLLGFAVDPQTAPTFAAYFAGSDAHSQCYELRNGSWARIENPATTRVKAGKAYWVFSKGGSDYQGPLDLKLPGADRLAYAPEQKAHKLTVAATGTDPASIYLTPKGDAFRLRLRERIPQTLSYTSRDIISTTHAADVEAGDDNELVLQIDAGNGSANMLLELSDTSGCLYHIPIEYLSVED